MNEDNVVTIVSYEARSKLRQEERRKQLLEDRKVKVRLAALGILPASTSQEIMAAYQLEFWNSLTTDEQEVETRFKRLNSIYYRGNFDFNIYEVSQVDIDWYYNESLRRALESDQIAEKMSRTPSPQVNLKPTSNIQRLAILN